MSNAEDRRRAHELRDAYHAGRAGAGKHTLRAGADRHEHDAYEQGHRDKEAEDGATTQATTSGPPAKRNGALPQTARRTTAPAKVTPARKPKPRTPGYVSRAFSPRAAGGRIAANKRVQRTIGAGDSGGLLLALVVYPLVLATIKYGAAGPGDWFRAKWLNHPVNPATGSSDPNVIPGHGSIAPGARRKHAVKRPPRPRKGAH